MHAYRTLVVSSTSILRDYFSKEIGSWPGFSVCGAVRPEDVLVRGMASAPDIVLIDLDHAGSRMDLDRLRVLRAVFPNTVLVVLSNGGSGVFQQLALGAGASAYLRGIGVRDLEVHLRQLAPVRALA